jgi:hypothetical protein
MPWLMGAWLLLYVVLQLAEASLFWLSMHCLCTIVCDTLSKLATTNRRTWNQLLEQLMEGGINCVAHGMHVGL